jgi:hypothetical protein
MLVERRVARLAQTSLGWAGDTFMCTTAAQGDAELRLDEASPSSPTAKVATWQSAPSTRHGQAHRKEGRHQRGCIAHGSHAIDRGASLPEVQSTLGHGSHHGRLPARPAQHVERIRVACGGHAGRLTISRDAKEPERVRGSADTCYRVDVEIRYLRSSWRCGGAELRG